MRHKRKLPARVASALMAFLMAVSTPMTSMMSWAEETTSEEYSTRGNAVLVR